MQVTWVQVSMERFWRYQPKLRELEVTMQDDDLPLATTL